ncbi:unnamed protein product [Prunus armeniaca]|uniref:Reverse transcriptase domain-containing protein n=1 Tax=Prunus armeniaca TaxID=36596 RepID=A0A6J5W1H8_PRUAR|nr:unnamed protein product [Prunus armeniaca]
MEQCQAVVKERWCREFKRSKGMQVFEKLKWVRKGLVDWKRQKWRSSKVYIENLREELCAALRGPRNNWKLKSRVQWLQEGDKNTKFFHSKTISRRRINRLHGLKDQGGIWYGEAYDIWRIAKSYFQDLFMFGNPVGIDEILECVHATVSFQDNISLSKPILANEVVAAVKQLNPIKSPGPYGFTGSFYQNFWATIGGDILEMVNTFFHYGRMLQKFNHTHIVLIYNVEKPRRMT